MTHSSDNPLSYRKEIDGLRAIAVVAVVVFHAFPAVLPGGFIGVDVFFVISGFLITLRILHGIENEVFQLRDFYGRRVRRIFPALVVVLVGTTIAGWFILLRAEFMQIGKHLVSGALFVLNFALVAESSYFDTAADTKPLLHLWSLAVEEQFYIAFPVLLVLLKKFKALVVPSLIICGFTSFLINLFLSYNDPVSAFYLPFGRVWELLVGSLIAHVTLTRHRIAPLHSSRLTRRWLRVVRIQLFSVTERLGTLFGLSLIALGLLIIDGDSRFPSIVVLLPVIGAALVIVGGGSSRLSQLLLMNKIAVWIGLISYALYLWHWPILVYVSVLYGETPPLLARAISVGLAVVLSQLTYVLIEKRARQSPLRARNAVKLSIPLALLGVIGFAIFNGQIGPRFIDQSASPDDLLEIRPTPTAAKQDCLARLGIKNGSNIRYCQLSSEENYPTVAVIGDSHSAAAFSGISHYLEDIYELSSVNLGSRLFSNVTIANGRSDSDEFAVSLGGSEIAEFISSSEEIETLVIFSRGVAYLETPYFVKNDDPELTDKEEIYFSALWEVMEVYRSKRVYFVLENPTLDFDPLRCSARPVTLGVPDCSITIVEDAELHRDFNARIIETLSYFPNVVVIDPRDVLCGETVCVATSGGVVLYSDRNHLNTYGSFLQGRYIVDQMVFDLG